MLKFVKMPARWPGDSRYEARWLDRLDKYSRERGLEAGYMTIAHIIKDSWSDGRTRWQIQNGEESPFSNYSNPLKNLYPDTLEEAKQAVTDMVGLALFQHLNDADVLYRGQQHAHS